MMKGLIKKDLLMIKSNTKTLLILLVVYGVLSWQEQVDLTFLLPFMSVMLMISTFSYDAYNKWDAYACTLPSGRKKSVKAKYLTTLLLVIATSLIVTVLSTSIIYVRTSIVDYEKILESIMGTFLATALIISFMFPAIYKFGVEKARIGIFAIVFGIAIIGGVIARFVDFGKLLQDLTFLNNYWIIILPIITIIMLFVSYKISERIYEKKEY